MRLIARLAIAAMLTAGLLTGCRATDVPVVSAPSPQATGAALALAQRSAAAGVQQATYTFDVTGPAVPGGARTGTGTAAVALPRFRVRLPGSSIEVYGTPRGTFRCLPRHRSSPCTRLAGPGALVPVAADPLLARLFTLDLDVLGVRPDAFAVTAAPGIPAQRGLPAAACWTVHRAGQPVTPLLAGVDLGRYCLSATGTPVAFQLAGSSLRLVRVGPAPTPASLRLPR